MNKATSVEKLIASITRGSFTLDGRHLEVNGKFRCSGNKLTSLKGCPSTIGGNFYCNENRLTTFEYCPIVIDGNFLCHQNIIKSLHNIHNHIKLLNGIIYLDGNPINSSILGLLKIEGLKAVSFSNTQLEDIINKHLTSSKDILDCAEELVEAGYSEYAQL